MNLLKKVRIGQPNTSLEATQEQFAPSDTQQLSHSEAVSKSPEAIQSWLVSQLSEKLELSADEIDIHREFTEYGLNSIEAVNLSGGLENFLDCRLSPTLVWDYPNIATLVQHLTDSTEAHSPSAAELSPQQNIQPAEAQELLDNLDQLPDDAVDTLLNSMLPDQATMQK